MNSKVFYQVIFTLGIVWSVAACDDPLGSFEISDPDGGVMEVQVHCTASAESDSGTSGMVWVVEVGGDKYELVLLNQEEPYKVSLLVVDADADPVALVLLSNSGESWITNDSDTIVLSSSPKTPLSPGERSRFDSHVLALLDRNVISQLAKISTDAFEGNLDLSSVNAFVNSGFEIVPGDYNECNSACGTCLTTPEQFYCCETSMEISVIDGGLDEYQCYGRSDD